MIGPDDRTHTQCPERVGRRLVPSSKGIPLEKSFGEWTRLAKFSARFGEKLMETIGRLLEESHHPGRLTARITALVFSTL